MTDYTEILKAADEQRQRTMRRENIACNILGGVLLGFFLITFLMWVRII